LEIGASLKNLQKKLGKRSLQQGTTVIFPLVPDVNIVFIIKDHILQGVLVTSSQGFQQEVWLRMWE